MGRPPCCDKVGIKKGPWTPEEDIILVSYIQEHGPGNWRSVPTNTGLLRCSKSCRLRWTNYLRPGIKRGNFTPHEEGMIIHLQALLGNKWAAIASYLPQRTDNDIKNYWNTHLKKKLKKLQSALDPHSNMMNMESLKGRFSSEPSRSSTGTQAHTAPYASSTENISRLLEGWMRSSPSKSSTNTNIYMSSTHVTNNTTCCPDQQQQGGGGDFMSREEFDSILTLENLNNVDMACWDDKSSTDSASDHNNSSLSTDDPPQLSVLDKWFLDESSADQVVQQEIMDLSPILI